MLVAPGEYTESLTLKNGVTLKGEDRDTTIIHCLLSTGHVLTITNCATGSVQDLTLEHLPEEFDPEVERERTEAVVITDSTVNIINCTIRNGNGNGISIKGTGKTTVRDCLLTENGANGITIFNGGARTLIENNKLIKNTFSGIYYYGNSGGTAKNNTASENGGSGIVVDYPKAIPLLTGNTMRNNVKSGLTIWNGAAPITFSNDYKHNGELDQQAIRRLFTNKRFDDIEYIAERLRAKEMRYTNGDWQIGALYIFLESGTQSMEEDAEEEYLATINEWKERYPSSPTWRLVLAKAQIHFAWRDRGTGYSGEVSDEGWAGFYEHLNIAWAALQEAKALDANEPEVYVSLVEAALLLGDRVPQPRSRIAGLVWNKIIGNDSNVDATASAFTEGSAKFPLYTRLYHTRIQSLLPRWGGSTSAIERLAANAADATQDLQGDGLYALIAQETFRWEGESDYKQEYSFSDARVIQGFQDLVDTIEKDGWHRNWLTRFACIARDKETAAVAFDNIGEAFNTGAWPTHLRFIEYRDWATGESEYPGKSQLGIAVTEGNRNRVAGLLDSGKSANRTVEDGEPLINVALKEGHIEIARLLIEAGADLNEPSRGGKTPAMFASENAENELLEILLQKGASPNAAKSNGWTPLMYAAYKSNAEGVRLLLEHGADLNAANSSQWMAIHFGAYYRNREILEDLLARGANINARNENGSTPLTLAAQGEETDAVLFLIEKGADIQIAMHDGDTALHNAAFHGNLTVAKRLIELGADVNAYGREDSDRPIDSAAFGGSLEMVKFLVESGADIHAKIDVEQFDARQVALDAGHTEVAHYLEREMTKP